MTLKVPLKTLLFVASTSWALASWAQAPKDTNALPALSMAAQNAGIRTCKPMTEQVHRYLVGPNSKSTGLYVAAPANANAKISSSIIEIENNLGNTITYTSASFAPYGESGCGVAYDAVTYWKESCAELASKVLKELKPVGTLGNKIEMLDGGPNMRMFLMPAGTGCVQIKKEILY